MAEQPTTGTFPATVSSRVFTGEAELAVSEEGLALTGALQASFIAFAQVSSFETRGYTLCLTAGEETFIFSKLGTRFDSFVTTLETAYNTKVLKALFVTGEPKFSAEGDFRFVEVDGSAQGRGMIQIYDDCICILPTTDQARRIPLVFVTDIQKGAFEQTFILDTGERYTIGRLGNHSDAFEACILRTLHTLEEGTIKAIRRLDETLSPHASKAIAHLMGPGVAAPVGDLAGISPSFVQALEAAIGLSRSGETYAAVKTIVDPAQIRIGMTSDLSWESADTVLWFIAPSPTKPIAAVEFAPGQDTAATFVYNLTGDNPVRTINRALEAVHFRREVISAGDDQLTPDQVMALQRTSALRLLRASLAARVIHSGLDAWTKRVQGYLT